MYTDSCTVTIIYKYYMILTDISYCRFIHAIINNVQYDSYY